MSTRDGVIQEELRTFVAQWEKRNKGNLDPQLVPALLAELDGMPEEEIDRLCDQAN